jgi:hypothetical protein
VRGNQFYNATDGFGWTQSVSEFQRATGGTKVSQDLYRDGHWGTAPRTFDVAVEAGQEYSVRVYVGDPNFARNNIQVRLEGGAWQNVTNTPAGDFQTLVLSGTSSDDRLNISIRNNGGDPYWVINGIDVWKRPAATPRTIPAKRICWQPTWSSEMVGQWLTEDALDALAPLAREYWVSTGLADWQVAELQRTPISIGDLSYRGALGVTRPEGIWLDASGAGVVGRRWAVGGVGWAVGGGQWAVGSGQLFGSDSSQRTTANGQLPAYGYDLLTVLTHELGHVIGYDDLDPLHHSDHIMAGVLQPTSGRRESHGRREPRGRRTRATGRRTRAVGRSGAR